MGRGPPKKGHFMQNEVAELLTVAELSRRWRLSERHLRLLIARGDLPVVRIGRSVRIHPIEAEKFVSERADPKNSDST